MNIRKIIKEEIDDFDWVNKVIPTIRPSDLVGYSITYLGPPAWIIIGYGEDEGVPYLTLDSKHGVSNMWLSHVIKQTKEGNYTIRDKEGNVIEPQEFRVLKESDFDWTDDVPEPMVKINMSYERYMDRFEVFDNFDGMGRGTLINGDSGYVDNSDELVDRLRDDIRYMTSYGFVDGVNHVDDIEFIPVNDLGVFIKNYEVTW